MMAEDVRAFLKEICGHRFGFGSVGFEVKEYDKQRVLDFIESLEERVKWFEDWIVDIPSLWDRFDTTGILSEKRAEKYGVVGVVARASGVETDRRENSFYKEHGFVLQNETSGDVSARFRQRIKEIYNSMTLVRNFTGSTCRAQIPDKFQDGEYMSFTESSIGELFMYVKLKDGVVQRFYIRDPGFVNWQALYLMMENDIIADFPLINKSCDLSYAGCDL
jgi:Ni,Fe-hydrogenase III large subunit